MFMRHDTSRVTYDLSAIEGLRKRFGEEGHTMRLPDYHDELVEQVAAANPRTVVMVYCSTPVAMDPWFEEVPALVLPGFSGMENGNALAAVLSGDEDFGGRMPITFPKQYTDSPAHPDRQPGIDKGKTILHSEGVFVGYRWFDEKKIEPLIPFGHGRSYTRFDYRNLTVVDVEIFPIRVSVDVKNCGERDGTDVVQLYIHDLESALPRPPRELKGFESVTLKTGETRHVEFELGREAFSYYDPDKKAWVLEPGTFEIQIGASSRNIKERVQISR